MKPKESSSVKNLLTNDVLLSIFAKTSILHRKRLSLVCRRWKQLIDVSFKWITVFSAVDDRRCVASWQPSNWLSLKFVSPGDYIRIPKVSPSEILCNTAGQLPNLRAIDLECCDMNNRIIRNILNKCKQIERINFDSSTRLNYYTFNLIVQDWNNLRHVNLSCCTEVGEQSASFLIQKLPSLESLNLCGTRITGMCLDKLNCNMKRLDISYCWGVQALGLSSLARARCHGLIELSVNNFDFDGSEHCMISLWKNFPNLQHLQMSIGPCVAHDYFIDRITTTGFSSIGQLKDLETLIIEKICIIDNGALLNIIKGCPKLKHLRLNLGWLNYCTDLAFANLELFLPNLEELHILYPSNVTCQNMRNLSRLKRLRSLSLVNTNIGNEIFKHIEQMESLVEINFDDSRKITMRGWNCLCKFAADRPESTITASLLGSGILVNRLKSKKNHPQNLKVQVSNFKSTKGILQFPLPL